MTAPAATSPAAASFPPWCGLPRHVIAHLPIPADRARLRAVCRASHATTREHARRQLLPWVVLPDGSFCTAGGDDGGIFFPRIPGLPDDATCLGAAAGPGGGSWLALDRTGATHRRTSLFDKIQQSPDGGALEPRGDVRHRHAYLLHNPFSGAVVPLLELDAIAGEVVEAFEVRKVLMRSGSPDDVIAVATNCRACSVIVLRPGKGVSVLRHLPVFDVAFVGDKLYGITPDEDLIAFDLAEDGNGRPVFAKFKRVIRHPLADGDEDLWSWMDEDDDDSDNNDSDDDDSSSSNGEGEESDDDDENCDNDDDDDEEEESGGERPIRIEESFNAYGKVPDGTVIVEDTEGEKASNDDDEPKDQIITTRFLLRSSNGKELLMARHHVQLTPFSGAYTRELELFRADLDSGKWAPVTRGDLAGEAVFLSRSFSTSTSAYGGIDEGCAYFAANVDDVFGTRSWTSRAFSLPWQRKLFNGEFFTWLFPPELVL